MSNIFNPSGGTTTVTDLSGNNWKALYTNGSGTVTELALGADGTTLVGNGTSSAPTFGNLTDLKGGNDKVLFTNSSGVLTELAIGATGTFLKSAGTTSNPTWAAPSSANWSQIGTGTASTASTTIFNLTSLDYRAIRGWYTMPAMSDGTHTFIDITFNGLGSSGYKYVRDYLNNTTYTGSFISAGSAVQGAAQGDVAYVQFFAAFQAKALDTTNKGVISGYLDGEWPVEGYKERIQFTYYTDISSDSGITAVHAVGKTPAVNSGYASFFVEGYTAD
jgi:hypothetical protein|tara:strand:+ start:167 stop:994 length:828 start_codon:yes stop_codon:yes gene_type:complete